MEGTDSKRFCSVKLEIFAAFSSFLITYFIAIPFQYPSSYFTSLISVF